MKCEKLGGRMKVRDEQVVLLRLFFFVCSLNSLSSYSMTPSRSPSPSGSSEGFAAFMEVRSLLPAFLSGCS